jgi:Reverse transcriptase (RNA-dependent DNA polymerase)
MQLHVVVALILFHNITNKFSKKNLIGCVKLEYYHNVVLLNGYHHCLSFLERMEEFVGSLIFASLTTKFCKRYIIYQRYKDILLRRSGYAYFTKLDISMQYYTFELDESSKEVCTICTPFGNYKYNRLPLGVSQALDISQEIMEDLFRNFNEVAVYIDDVGVFSKDWDTHHVSLSHVLKVLETNDFTVNPAKCE